MVDLDVDQTCRFAPTFDLFIREPEPVMRVIGPHRLVGMGAKINDDKSTARAQRPCSFCQRRGRIIKEVQDMMQHRHINRARIEAKVIRAALPNRAVAQTKLVEAAACEVEHLLAEVESDPLVDSIGEDFEHPPGPGADVDELSDSQPIDCCQHGGLDLVIGHMADPHVIPAGGNRLEVGSSDLGSLGTDRREPAEVALQARIVLVDERSKRVEELAALALAHRTVEGTRSLGMSVEQSGFAEQAQVTAHSRLRLAQHPTQLGDGQFTSIEHGKDAQPRRLASSAQADQKLFHQTRARVGLSSISSSTYLYALISSTAIDAPTQNQYASLMTDTSTSAIPLLKSHRSIRKFTDEPISDELVEDIIGAGLAAATSSNLQGTTVIRVRNPATRAAIATLAGGQSYVETCAAFFIWCADLHRSAVACEMGGGTLSAGMTEHFIIATTDCALAAQNAVVAAESVGLGICYIGGIRNDPQQVADLLELPDQVYPVFGLCLGWPDQDPMLKPRLPLSVTLKEERYDESTDREGIAGYDETLRSYYLERTGGKRDSTWTADMSSLLGKESRPHMREFLANRGFTMR